MRLGVVLLHKVRQNIPSGLPHFLVQEKAVPAQNLAAPDKEHLNADPGFVGSQANHVPVPAFGGGLLLFFQPFQALEGIPVVGGLFVLHSLGSLEHFFRQVLFQFPHLPVHQQQYLVHQFPVLRKGHLAGTGRQAAMEMVLEAGPLHIHVPAMAQGEHGANQLHGVPQGAGVRKRPVVLGPVLEHPPGQHHPGVRFLHGNFQVGIRLVVLQVNIVPGPVFLDQVAFQNQGFHFAGRNNGFNRSHVGIDGPDLGRALGGLPEIAAHPVFQDNGLSYVNHLAGTVVHNVDPWGLRQDGQGIGDGLIHTKTFFTYCPV